MGEGDMPPIWSPDVAQAIAQHMSMPGLENLQHQYVRYQGQVEATQTDEGWTCSESEAQWNSAQAGDASAEPFNAGGSMPQQVQLNITAAPAEFCLPMKNDRQFKPHFQVQVRVVHSGNLHLPLRLKAFAIVHDEMQQIREWLPEELKDSGMGGARSRVLVELKGSTVVSYVFQTATTASGHPTILQTPQMPSISGRVNPADAPLNFPSKAAKAALDRPLKHNDSIRSQDDDPEMATPLNLGSVCNTVVAQYEFKSLEFARPTRMNPAYMVFACLVADQDLLFCVYEVPCISICRAEQRAKALERLGMPASVYQDISDRGGNAPIVTGSTADKRKTAAAAAADDGAGKDSLVDMWNKVADNGMQPAAAPQLQPFDPEGNPVINPLMSDGSVPLLPDGSFLSNLPMPSFNTDGASLDGNAYHLPAEDLNATQQLEATMRANTAKLFAGAAAGAGDGAGPPGAMANPSLTEIANLMNMNGLSGLGSSLGSFGASLGAGQRSGPEGGGAAAAAVAFDGAPSGGGGGFADAGGAAPAADLDGMRLSKRQISGRDRDDNDPLFHTGIDAAAAAASGRHVRPAAAAPSAEARPSACGGAAAAAPGAGGFPQQWLAAEGAADAMPEEGQGVTQLDAYNWTIEEYNSTGLQRMLQRQDYQALLSLAGFPVLAGLDTNARVHERQFVEYQRQLRAALAMLRSISALWNRQDPCVISGFDMDRAKATQALAAQPLGTFVCRFSMNRSGCLVLSCKVRPGTAQAEGDVLHITIAVSDLREQRIETVILRVPYASHVLDVYTNRREDKRTLLQSGYTRVNRLFHPAEMAAHEAAAAVSGGAPAQSVSHSVG